MRRINSYMIYFLLIFLFAGIGPWHSYADAQSDMKPYRLSHLARGEEGRMYALSTERGALLSLNRGQSWDYINRGLPKKEVWPFEGDTYRSFTSMAVDSKDPRRIAATTSSSLFISVDGGGEWNKIELKDPVKSSNYLTAISFDTLVPDRMYLGTSFNGLFVSEDGGKSWEKISRYLGSLYRGAGFYEEITDLTMVPRHRDELFIASGFDHVIYRYNTAENAITDRIELPEETGMLASINSYSGGVTDSPALEVHFEEHRYIYDLSTDLWRSVPTLLRGFPGAVSAGKESGKADYDDIRAVYLNAYNARGDLLKGHLEFLKEHGFNAIVVDLKDDWGRLTYASELKIPKQIDAVHPVLDVETLIREAHEAGIYVIGRMVVFKDKRLYRMENEKYAIWDTRSSRGWAHKVPEEREVEGKEETETVYVQREFWTDPFSEFVWDYNISIAVELEEKGIDEIQFDYIRFPSDGDLGTVRYRHRREGMLKTEAIESFIKKARRALELPISTDLYGFNSWYRMGNWIGQDLEMISRYVEVICPMYYPSHFPGDFLDREDYIDRAFELYKIGTERAQLISKGRSLIRPYVQAFLIGRELSMEEEDYHLYLNRQLEGVLQAGGCGYTLWNNMNRYYMVNGRVMEMNLLEFDTCKEKPRKTPSS